jgi:hypothetical protein
MPTDSNKNNQMPLRAGYNSLVPDPDKWLQFDRDLMLARQLQLQTERQSNHFSLVRHWYAIIQKLQPKPARHK